MQTNQPKIDSSNDSHVFVKYAFKKVAREEMLSISASFRITMQKRRSVRDFSAEEVPLKVVQDAVSAACSAPSGANKQPWHFCIIGDHHLKSQIREAAEAEEIKSYQERMSDQWLKDLEPLGTNHIKPFLEEAPYLIAIFKKPYEQVSGKKVPNYYVNESVGIATGILIAALQSAGLATLTHTPSPMNFLQKILKRPENERPYLLLPVGYPKKNTEVPKIHRKALKQVVTEYF